MKLKKSTGNKKSGKKTQKRKYNRKKIAPEVKKLIAPPEPVDTRLLAGGNSNDERQYTFDQAVVAINGILNQFTPANQNAMLRDVLQAKTIECIENLDELTIQRNSSAVALDEIRNIGQHVEIALKKHEASKS